MHDKAGVVNDETAEKELEVTGEDDGDKGIAGETGCG